MKKLLILLIIPMCSWGVPTMQLEDVDEDIKTSVKEEKAKKPAIQKRGSSKLSNLCICPSI